MKRKRLEREDLQDLLNRHESVGKVASVLGLPYSTVYAWYKNCGIKLLPSSMTIFQELRSVPLCDLQKSLILGSILGDGFLVKSKRAKNARFSVGHSGRQIGYLEWKKRTLSPFSRPIIPAEKAGRKVIQGVSCESTGYYILNTIAHPDIQDIYKVYYNRYGKKRIVSRIIDDLDLLGLAVWLGDDGSFSLHNDCKYSLRGSIATIGFSDEEQEFCLSAFKKFYKGHASIGYHSKEKNQKAIYFSGTDAVEELLDAITPLLPEALHYKLVPQRLHAKLHRVRGG